LAKLLGDPAVSVSSALTAPHVAVGTPLYMAPEQMRNALLDGRADVYAASDGS